MSDYDINESKRVRARRKRNGKLHWCTGCFCDIPVKTEVWRADYNYDGRFWHNHYCDFCWKFMDKIDTSDGVSEGYTLENMLEVYDSEAALRKDLCRVKMLPGQESTLIAEWNKRQANHEQRKKRFFEEQR